MRPAPIRRAAARTPLWIAALGLASCADPHGVGPRPGVHSGASDGAPRTERDAERDGGSRIGATARSIAPPADDPAPLTWADLSLSGRRYFLAALNEDHLDGAFGDKSTMRFDPERVALLVAEWTSIHDELATVHEELAAEADAIREKLRGSPQHGVHPSPECELEPGFFGAQVSGLFRLPLVGRHPEHIEWVEFSLAERPAFASAHRRCADLDQKRAAMLTKASTALVE